MSDPVTTVEQEAEDALRHILSLRPRLDESEFAGVQLGAAHLVLTQPRYIPLSEEDSA